jgi:hypothetical protein
MAKYKDPWAGWLIDNLGHRNDEVFAHIEQAIHSRKIPMHGQRDRTDSVKIETNNVDMWWRRDSKQLKVTSEMDGKVIANIISQDYGTSLFVGLHVERQDGDYDNWAKQMAGGAFKSTIKRVIAEAISEIAADNTVTDVVDVVE